MAKWHEEHPDYGAVGVFAGYMEYCQMCGQYNPDDNKCNRKDCPHELREVTNVGSTG